MTTPFSENFDKVALSGPLTGNLAPAAALEAQNLLGQQKTIGLQQAADCPVTFAPLDYGAKFVAKSVADAQNALSVANQTIRPSDFLGQGLFQAGEALRNKMLSEKSTGAAMSDAPPTKIKDLSVVVSTNAADNSATADFLVKKDGSIQLLRDPDRDPSVNADHKLVIALEADGNHLTGRSLEQQTSLDLLSKYIATRYMDVENGKLNGSINDNGLISADIKKALGVKNPEDQLPEVMHQQVDRYNQLESANRSYIAPQDIGNYTSSGDSRYQQGNIDDKSTENTWSHFNAADGNDRYTHVGNVLGDQRGWGFGRYMFTYDMFLRWLFGRDPASGFNIDDLLQKDKDRAKYDSLIAKMVKDGKLSKEMAKEFTSPEFKNFMSKLQAGGKLTPELAAELKSDIEKFMPAQRQEQIGLDLKEGFQNELLAKNGHVNQGELVLALLLGHLPTKEDLNKPAYKALLQQAETARQLSLTHLQHPGEGIVAYHVTGNPSSPMAFKLASHFMDNARSTEPGGFCAGKLASSMEKVGLGKWRNDATPMATSMLRSGEWVAINPDKTAPGDVVYEPHAAGRGGHIEGVVSVGANGYLLASDFYHTVKNIQDNHNGYYAGLTVMRYVGPGGAKDLTGS